VSAQPSLGRLTAVACVFVVAFVLVGTSGRHQPPDVYEPPTAAESRVLHSSAAPSPSLAPRLTPRPRVVSSPDPTIVYLDETGEEVMP
jgi:hypothetical protein